MSTIFANYEPIQGIPTGKDSVIRSTENITETATMTTTPDVGPTDTISESATVVIT